MSTRTNPGRVHRRRFGHQAADDFTGQFLIHVQAHVSQLQADVGVELIGCNGVENLMIKLGAVAGLVGIGDIFAQVVDADAHAGAVDGLRGADGIGDLGASNEAAGDAAAERERSAKLRRERFSERRTKNALNMPHLKMAEPPA